jgi:hypothetical protein
LFLLALNVVGLALLVAGVIRALQGGVTTGVLLSAIVVAILIGNVRAGRAARRLATRRASDADEGGDVAPPSLT